MTNFSIFTPIFLGCFAAKLIFYYPCTMVLENHSSRFVTPSVFYISLRSGKDDDQGTATESSDEDREEPEELTEEDRSE